MKKFLEWTNENHWYIIAAIVICAILVWVYGCQSQVTSMIDHTKKVTRAGLQVESDYLLGQIKVKLEDLDQQDELKRLILDQASVFATTGTFNPLGLLNTLISVAAISFGLNRNQKLYALQKTTTPSTAGRTPQDFSNPENLCAN
jgi:hypothetical protein